MPKSQIRYKHMDIMGGSCSDTVAAEPGSTRRSPLLSAPPRKVSFEDSRKGSNPSVYSDDTVPTENNKKKPAKEIVDSEQERGWPLRRKRSLLVRPITSLSLVDLAKSVAHDSLSPMISGQSDVDQIEGRNSKRVCSFNLSPRNIVHAPDLLDVSQQSLSSLQPSSGGESKSIRTSPWGHFIDMAPDEDYYDYLPITAYPNYDRTLHSNRRRASHCSCEGSLCPTRRRPSPYGGYKSYTTREAQPDLNFIGLRTDPKSNGNFRLSPRSKVRNHKLADELIGVFSELQMQHVQQKTI
jgi:hypothetical protein